jgi:hypothetical protein
MELEPVLRILSFFVGVATLAGRSLVASDDEHGLGTRNTARAQALASRALELLRRNFGDRLLSLQLLASSLMLALSAISIVYLKTLADVGAGAALFSKYAVVLTASLAGFVVTFTRGSRPGLFAFMLILLTLSALEGTRALTYSTLFMLASPGMLATFLTLPAARWCLRRAQTSGRAVAWLTGLAAAPVACVGAYGLAVRYLQPAAPRLSGFFSTIGIALVLSCGALVSMSLLVSALGMYIQGAAFRVGAGRAGGRPDQATVRRRMSWIALLSIGLALAPAACNYLENLRGAP